MKLQEKIDNYLTITNEKKNMKTLDQITKTDVKWIKKRLKDIKSLVGSLENGVEDNDGEKIFNAINQIEAMVKMIKSSKSGLGSRYKIPSL